MTTTPQAVVDVLESLLEAQASSVFRIIESSGLYLDRSAAAWRQPLAHMAAENQQQVHELSHLVQALGGSTGYARVTPDEQYLAFLSFKFLLPRLAQEKQLLIERYQNALSALSDAPAEVVEVLRRHLKQHQADYEVLNKAKP